MTPTLNLASDTVSPSSRTRAICVTLAIAVLWLSTLGIRALFDPDEGRYAEIPREMVASGDWITPRLNGIKYFEKPPLQYWATAAAYQLVGFSPWSVRLWPALMAFLTVGLTWWAGRRHWGANAGRLAALVLLGSPYFVVFGHVATLDMGITAFLTLSLVAFLRLRQAAEAGRPTRPWADLMWLAMGLSVLSKGLIGVVLPLAACVAYVLLARDRRVFDNLHPLRGMLLLLLVTAPWFIAVSLRNPEFPQFFFIHEHFARYTSTVHHRAGPIWYYLPIVSVALFPWLIVLGRAVRRAWTSRFASPGSAGKTFRPGLFLTSWVLVVFAFFSVSGSKLPAYTLPLMPAAALLIGREAALLSPRQRRREIGYLAALGAVGLFVFVEVVEQINKATSVFDLYENFSHWAEPAAIVLFLGAAFEWWRRGSALSALAGTALCGFVASHLLIAGATELTPLNSAHELAQKIEPFITPQSRLFSVGMYQQTLTPYTGRTWTLVAYQDEMAFGIEQEPQRWISNLHDFENAWRDTADAIAVMRPSTYDELLRDGLAMKQIAVFPDKIAVAKP